MSTASTLASLASRALVRTGLVGAALLDRRSFWIEAVLGRNQLAMHDLEDGAISIGKVSEQLYSEGFLPAYHRILTRELGEERAREVLIEVGTEGASWEIEQAIAHGIWVPRPLRPLIGRRQMLDEVRRSALYRALVTESLRIVFRMIMTEGGWGVIEKLDLASDPVVIAVRNTPESRQLGPSERPTCAVAAGIYRAYVSRLFGVPCDVREASCQSMGAERCTFEITIREGKAD